MIDAQGQSLAYVYSRESVVDAGIAGISEDEARRIQIAERIPGCYAVKDATRQALAYVYARETRADASRSRC